ncbi:MAG TPA: universal stress protein [Methanocella sp.]|nr:universal stress protein [Methanocella sp.]
MSILVATDGTPQGEKIVRFAIDLAKCRKTALIVLHIIRSKRGVDNEKIIKDGMLLLEKIKDVATSYGVTATTMLESGVVYEMILDKARENNAEVIVVGTSGKSQETQTVGSTSDYIVHNARCTVVLVK